MTILSDFYEGEQHDWFCKEATFDFVMILKQFVKKLKWLATYAAYLKTN